MMSRKIINVFLKKAKDSWKKRPILLKAMRYYRKWIIERDWEAILTLLLRYIDYKKYKTVVKLDLWDEVVLFAPLRKEIIKKLKPDKLLYIDFVKEFSIKFNKIYNSKNEIPIVGDIKNWPFKDNSIDVIVDMSTSDHLKLKDFKKLIGEYKRTLKPGGFLLLYHLNNEYYFIKKYLSRETSFPTYPRSPTTIETILKKNNFEIVRKFYLFTFLTSSALEMSEIWRRAQFILSLFIGKNSFYLFHLIFGGEKLSSMLGYLVRKNFNGD
jgi:SAM-dependent methyltransferase